MLSEDRRQVLLTHHRKARTWFQLGGHAEPGDADVAAAASVDAAAAAMAVSAAPANVVYLTRA